MNFHEDRKLKLLHTALHILPNFCTLIDLTSSSYYDLFFNQMVERAKINLKKQYQYLNMVNTVQDPIKN